LRQPRYSGPQHFTMVYQAPDRSELTGPEAASGTSIITVGGVRYSQSLFTSTRSQWIAFKVPSGEPGGRSMATGDLTALQNATSVEEDGSSFRVVEIGEVLPGSLLARSAGVGEDEDIFTATVAHGRVVREVLDFRSQKSSLEVTLIYSRFGSAPAIEIPAAEQTLTICGGRPLPTNAPCPSR